MLFSRGTLDAGFHGPGEIAMYLPLQNFPHKDQVLGRKEGDARTLLQDDDLLHPRDDRHHHGLCKTNDQQHAFRGYNYNYI